MRAVAFGFLVWAAFDLPSWHLDRLGVALVGLAFAVLAAVPVAPSAVAARPGTTTTTTTVDADYGLTPERLDEIVRASTRAYL